MTNLFAGDKTSSGWEWFDNQERPSTETDDDELIRSFARCFRSIDGGVVLDHLRQTILDRRLGPKASDAELRFLEGQRSVVAHIVSMLERGRS